MSERSREDRAWADYGASLREVVHQLATSASMLHIAEGVPLEIDADVIKAATQLGLMLLLDKPLVVVVPRGKTVSPALRRAAAVVLDDADMDSEATQARLVRAFEKVSRGRSR